MNIKNIKRAAEIAGMLPALAGARKLLSQTDGDIRMWVSDGKESHTLPRALNMNILQIINLEINALKKEVEGL